MMGRKFSLLMCYVFSYPRIFYQLLCILHHITGLPLLKIIYPFESIHKYFKKPLFTFANVSMLQSLSNRFAAWTHQNNN